MSEYVNEALLDASPYKKQQDEAKNLVKKWDKTGLLDGLNEDFKKNSMAVLLENQAKQLIQENNYTNQGHGAVGGDEEWSGVALPLVRRVFGEIAAQEFVSVQPMNLPSGLVFYLDFKYGSTTQGRTSGDSMAGKTGPHSPSGSTSPYPDGGLYGVGQYGYTAPSQSVSVAMSTGAVATMKDINYDADVSASYGGALVKITGTFGATDADKLSVRAWDANEETTTPASAKSLVLKQFSSITGDDNKTGTLSLIVSASSVANATGSYLVQYHKAPTSTTRGDFEDSVGDATVDTLAIPQVDIQLNSRAIVAKTRKLKAVWTPELAQDLNAYHSVDAEAELTSMLSEYIAMEIDLEILDMLMNDAVTTDYWSAKQGNDYDASANAFVNTTFYGTRFEWYQTLGQKIQKVSNTIHQLTLRGGANFLVCGPKIATVIESIPGFGAQTDGNKAQFAMGVNQVGTLQNRWNVYKNPYMTENQILVGFRGSNFLETGAVYAPYVPLIMTPLVYDPSDFTPRKGVMTRYAKKMIRPEFYGKIYVGDLDLI
tara:strand:- start:1384 stop:3009 length:1626 start_codon:yes stop_codon:yes gene_type:complete